MTLVPPCGCAPLSRSVDKIKLMPHINPNRRSRNYVFTYNTSKTLNILTTEAAEEQIQRLCPGAVKYVFYAREVAPKTGTKHLQGFICFKHAKILRTAKKFCGGPQAHLEVMEGSIASNVKYCNKEAGFKWEYGKLPMNQKEKGQISKDMYSSVIAYAKEGKMDLICEEQPKLFLVHYNKFRVIGRDFQKRPARLVSENNKPTGSRNLWIWGPAGVGKTFAAEAYSSSFYQKDMNRWWCGYQGEENVILDDIAVDQSFMARNLKIWGHEGPFNAQIKNGSTFIRPKRIIVTSQFPIEKVFPFSLESQAAIRRRYFVIHMTERQY